jgi:DNA integrity scanning protein DisA with diadenylate cyclase activity
VLIDPHGTCYAIGAILDGLATEKGDSSRGSRYNSALRYVESSDYPCLAVVVSEDGLVDVITSVQE